MNIFNNIENNNNQINKGKSLSGVEDNDLVNVSQLNELGAEKIDKNSTEIMYYEKKDIKPSVIVRNQSILNNITTNHKTSTKKHLNSNSSAWTFENKLFVVYNDNFITITQPTEQTIDCFEFIGDNFIAFSYFRTLQTNQGGTKIIDLRTNTEITLPTIIDGTKRHYIKYLESLNVISFVRFDIAKMYNIKYNNNFEKVSNVTEITIPSVVNRPLVEANKTHYFIMSKDVNTVICLNVSDNTVNTTLQTSLGTTFNNKVIYDLSNIGGDVVVVCKTAVVGLDYCFKINKDGSLTNLPINCDGFTLTNDGNSNLRIVKLNKNICIVQLNCVTSGVAYTTKLFLLDVTNGLLLTEKTYQNKVFLAYYDSLISTDGIYDYSFNKIDYNISKIDNTSKSQIFSNRNVFNNFDVLNYGEIVQLLENVDSDVNDSNFFVKVISDVVTTFGVDNYLKNDSVDTFIINNVQNLTTNTIFENSWAKIVMVDGQTKFIPIEIILTGVSSLVVTDLTNTLSNGNVNQIIIASKKVSGNVTTKFISEQKNNGFKVGLFEEDFVGVDLTTINTFITENDIEDLVYWTNIDNYKNDLISNNSQIIVKSTTENVITKNVNVFTNIGNNTNVESQKKNSNSVYPCTFGNLINNSVGGGFGSGLFMFDDGFNGTVQKEIIATAKIALKISMLMRDTCCDFNQAISIVTRTSSNQIKNNAIGFGYINYENALTFFDDFIYEKNKNKFKTNQKTISSLNDDSLVVKKFIPFINDNCTVLNFVLELTDDDTPLTSNTFVIGRTYIVSTLTENDNLTNIGFVNVGESFVAKGTTATTFTDTVVHELKYKMVLLSSIGDTSIIKRYYFSKTDNMIFFEFSDVNYHCSFLSNVNSNIKKESYQRNDVNYVSYGLNYNLDIDSDITIIPFQLLIGKEKMWS